MDSLGLADHSRQRTAHGEYLTGWALTHRSDRPASSQSAFWGATADYPRVEVPPNGAADAVRLWSRRPTHNADQMRQSTKLGLELITKNLTDGLTVARQKPEVLRKQTKAMFQGQQLKPEEEDRSSSIERAEVLPPVKPGPRLAG